MESESQPVSKKPRTQSTHTDLRVSECVRQFELPKQFPSTVTELCFTKPSGEKNIQSILTSVANQTAAKKVLSKKGVIPDNLQKVKLKLPDGRNLGEVKLKVVPGNDEKSKARVLSVPTSDNFVFQKAIEIQKEPNANIVVSPVGFDSNTGHVEQTQSYQVHFIDSEEPYEQVADMKSIIANTTKATSSVIKKNESVKPKIIQNCIINRPNQNNKLGSNATTQSFIVRKSADGKTFAIISAEKQSVLKSSLDKKVLPAMSKTLTVAPKPLSLSSKKEKFIYSFPNSNPSSVIRKRDFDGVTISNGKIPAYEVNIENSDIPISTRSYVIKQKPVNSLITTNNTIITQTPNVMPENSIVLLVPNDDANATTLTSIGDYSINFDNPETSILQLNNDVQESYNFDPDIMANISMSDNIKIIGSEQINVKENNRKQKFIASNSKFANLKNTISINGSKEKNIQSLINNQEFTNDQNELSILKKAVLSVEDEKLRAMALRVLQDCSIKGKRTIPKKNPDTKIVIDRDTQTEIFSLLEPGQLIEISQIQENLCRMTLEQSSEKHFKLISSNNQTEKLSNGQKTPDCFSQEINSVITKGFNNNEVVKKVEDDLKTSHTYIAKRVTNKLIKDFKAVVDYDGDGLLAIHRAVLDDNMYEVQKQLFIMKLTKQIVDIPTEEGMTSLELAVDYDVDPQIINVLLKAGAQPVSSIPNHDSAIIIAAKKSSPILPCLLENVKDQNKSFINAKDSEGLAAIHYCAQNGNLKGISDLLEAGAEVDVQDEKSGRTSLFYVLEKRNYFKVPQKIYYDIAQKLLECGANPNVQTFSRHSVLNFLEDIKNHALKVELIKAANR